jgi:hypothetical protein
VSPSTTAHSGVLEDAEVDAVEELAALLPQAASPGPMVSRPAMMAAIALRLIMVLLFLRLFGGRNPQDTAVLNKHTVCEAQRAVSFCNVPLGSLVRHLSQRLATMPQKRR